MIVDRYYYNQLNKREQAIYRAFYDGVKAHKDIIPIPVKGVFTKEAFNRIFSAITRDNPLIYYLNQSACNMAHDMLGHVAICPQYFFTKEKVKEYNRKVEKVVNTLIAQLKLTECSDYEKAIKVHDWLCKNVEYDEQGADINEPVRVIASHNIIGVFAHHRAQCEGIAKAVKVLLNAVDVKCIVATGMAYGKRENGPHAWNIVNLNDKPYHMDVTWDIGACTSLRGRIAYDYFNITDEMIGHDHKPEEKLPICNSLELNYFTKNKLAFDSKSQLLAYIEKSLLSGEKEFYFRLEGKLIQADMVNEVKNVVAKLLAGQGTKKVRIQHEENDIIRTCWIKIFM